MTIPGRTRPGTRTPAQPAPDLSTPGGTDTPSVSTTGVAVDATGTTAVGTVEADRVKVFAVTVDPTAADFDFNLNVDGEPAFAADQSPAAAEAEGFTTDDEAAITYLAVGTDIVFEVTSASGTGGATADITVDTVAESE